MLKPLLALLLAANLGFFAWSQGWFGHLMPSPEEQREPERLQRQLHPERIQLGQAQVRLIDPDSSAPAAPAPASTAFPATPAASVPPEAPAAPASAPLAAVPAPVCLEAGAYTEAEWARLEPTLQAHLPTGLWRLRSSEQAAGYMVYSGPYPDREALLRRQEELRERNVDFIEVREPPELARGLSLGRFRHRDNAERHVDDLEKRGVREIRVVPSGPLVKVYHVQVPAADAALQGRLADLPPRLLRGRAFGPCASPDRPASPAAR